MQRLRAALDAAGVTTWFDMDRLESGDDYDRKIQKNIARCSYFIPIVSATTERRLEAYFRREWSHALDRTRNMADDAIFILPVCIDQTEPRGAHPAAPAETQPAVDPQHPWLGLASFTEETRGYFHGREEEVAELGRRVQRKLLTILFGQSGLGKTSILRAGIVPRLRHKGYCPVYVRIDHSPESPTPTEQIKQAIHRATQSSGQWTQAGTAVEGESLWEFLHHRDDILRDAAGKTVIPLLIFDQFEEIFTLAQADDAITGRFDFGRVDYRILIALREDYLAHLSLICRELNNARIAQGRAEISADLLAGSNGTILAEFHERALADQPAAVRKVIEDQPLTESGYRESLAEERLRKAFAAAGAAPDALATLVNRRLLRIEERLDVRRVELTHDVLCGVVKASRELRLEREAKEEAERLLATQRARGEAEKLVVYLRRTSTSSSSPSGASTSSRSPWRPGSSVAARLAFGEIAVSYGFILMRDGALEDAAKVFERARAALRSIDGLQLADLSSAAMFVEATAWQMDALIPLGRIDEARRNGEEARPVANGILEKQPGHMLALRARALLLSNFGDLAARPDPLQVRPALLRCRREGLPEPPQCGRGQHHRLEQPGRQPHEPRLVQRGSGPGARWPEIPAGRRADRPRGRHDDRPGQRNDVPVVACRAHGGGAGQRGGVAGGHGRSDALRGAGGARHGTQRPFAQDPRGLAGQVRGPAGRGRGADRRTFRRVSQDGDRHPVA